MTNFIDKKEQLSEADVLGIKRGEVPDSAPLVQRILKATEGMPQFKLDQFNLEEAESAQKSPSWLKRQLRRFSLSKDTAGAALSGTGFKPYAVGLMAGVTVFVLTVVLITANPGTQLGDNSVDELSTLSSERLTQELLWQDLILMQDQLAFADL